MGPPFPTAAPTPPYVNIQGPSTWLSAKCATYGASPLKWGVLCHISLLAPIVFLFGPDALPLIAPVVAHLYDSFLPVSLFARHIARIIKMAYQNIYGVAVTSCVTGANSDPLIVGKRVSKRRSRRAAIKRRQ